MSFIPANGLSLIAWANNLNNVCGASPSSYNLSASDLTQLTSLLGQFTTDFGIAENAELARKAAVLQSNSTKAALVKKIRNINNKAQASTATSAAKAEAGLPVRDTSPSKVNPEEVKEISANGFETGQNKIKWTRSGNKPNMKFRLEASSDGIEWNEVATVTSTKYTHSNQIPGVTIWYRVFAFNQNGTAPASPVAVVYPAPSESSLSLAA